MKKLGLATALLLAMTGAQAYQFEVQGQSEYHRQRLQMNKDFTGAVCKVLTTSTMLTASKGPLAEAAFFKSSI